ncbi:amidohydrolase [Pseudomonas sp. D(2018)]|uniref:amidohydrolase n=1 Tax=Pseudomonas sp. D(2018) TaxID=2502238 RepID=UPI0010F826DA|nr:amidohydrolase family protein [Pseudomonas sp. D(2018)]
MTNNLEVNSMLTATYSKQKKLVGVASRAKIIHSESCGCKLTGSRFLQLVEAFAALPKDSVLVDWRVPVRLVQPYHWTCGAEYFQKQLITAMSNNRHDHVSRALLAAAQSPLVREQRESNTKPELKARTGEIDTVIVNGRIFTGELDAPWCEAVAIGDGLIRAVGTSIAMRALAGAFAEVIDVGGRTVIPGLNDAHMHHTPDPFGIRLPVDPMANPSFDEIRLLISEAVAASPAGTWIYATMGERLTNDKALDRRPLDEIAPDHPIIFLGMSNHTNVVNSAAMQRLGIRDEEPDPVGGDYERLPGSRRLSGRINEYAQWSPQRCFASMATVEEGAASLRALADECVRWGITTIQNMSWTPPERYLDMAKAADVPIKVRLIRFPPSGPEGRILSDGRGIKREITDRVEFHGTKWILDGTPIEGASAVSRPYSSDSPNRGQENFPGSEISHMLRESLGAKEQLLLHAIGDRALESVLNAIETFSPQVDWQARNLRIEHGDGLTREQVGRVKAAGAMVVQNPTHFWFYGGDTGFSIFDGAFQSLLDTGITVGIGSDGPLNPFLGLLAAVQHPARPHEAMSMENAVRAYTRGSAIAEGKGDSKGRLIPGQVADLAVLSQDIFSIEPQYLPSTQSVLTMVDGSVVFRDAGI